jgi:hypothetical protein
MPSITFQWDSRDLAAWRNAKVDKALAAALKKAGSDAARAMKAESSRRVRDRKRFKVSHVNKSTPLSFPRSKVISELVWRMDVSGAPSPLSAFPHRQTRKGVTVSVNKNGSKLIRSAFVATMKSGHKGVFVRRGNKRLPIDELFSTRISDVFRDQGMVPAVYDRTQAVFRSAFERLFRLELNKVV